MKMKSPKLEDEDEEWKKEKAEDDRDLFLSDGIRSRSSVSDSPFASHYFQMLKIPNEIVKISSEVFESASSIFGIKHSPRLRRNR